MTYRAYREIFVSKLATFPQFRVYSSITQAKQTINLVNYLSTISIQWYRTDEFKKRATNCCVRFWSLVMARNQLPAQVRKLDQTTLILIYVSFFFFSFFSFSSSVFRQRTMAEEDRHTVTRAIFWARLAAAPTHRMQRLRPRGESYGFSIVSRGCYDLRVRRFWTWSNTPRDESRAAAADSARSNITSARSDRRYVDEFTIKIVENFNWRKTTRI